LIGSQYSFEISLQAFLGAAFELTGIVLGGLERCHPMQPETKAQNSPIFSFDFAVSQPH
jgi:hypothetical protein